MILRKGCFRSPCKAGFPGPGHHGNRGSSGTSVTGPLLQGLWHLGAEDLGCPLIQPPCCIPPSTFSCSPASEDGGLMVSSSFHLLMLIILFPVLNENTLLYSFSSWVCSGPALLLLSGSEPGPHDECPQAPAGPSIQEGLGGTGGRRD